MMQRGVGVDMSKNVRFLDMKTGKEISGKTVEATFEPIKDDRYYQDSNRFGGSLIELHGDLTLEKIAMTKEVIDALDKKQKAVNELLAVGYVNPPNEFVEAYMAMDEDMKENVKSLAGYFQMMHEMEQFAKERVNQGKLFSYFQGFSMDSTNSVKVMQDALDSITSSSYSERRKKYTEDKRKFLNKGKRW